MERKNRIGIISAMREEIQALLNDLEKVSVTEKGMRKYYSGSLFGKEVVLVFSRWGKVASAATTTHLINNFKVDSIIFTGVAGALKKHLNIGDIIIGEKLYQHDMDASPLFKKFEIPILNKTYLEASGTSGLYQASESFLRNFNSYISKEDSAEFHIDNPKVVSGDIASGDQFISSNLKIDLLNEELPTACCVEMEGAAVAQVCFEYDIPFSIIRIISDKANDNATIDFPKFAKSIASNYALGILQQYFAEF